MPEPGPVEKQAWSQGPWPARLAVAALLLLPLALFLPAMASGTVPYGSDLTNLMIPFRAEIRRSLAAGEWPLWMPDVLGGMPGIAACNLVFLYPSDLLCTLSGWSLPVQLWLDLGLHVALAGLGMYLLLRRLGRSVSASLLSGLFFAWSGSQVTQAFGGYYNFIEGIAMVPWAFWAAHKGAQERSWAAWGFCGLAFGLQILSLSAQIFVCTLAVAAWFSLAMALCRDPQGFGAARQGSTPSVSRVLAGLALALGLALLLAAPQILPTLQYLPLTSRHNFSFAKASEGSIALSEALTWLVPGFFGWAEPDYHGAMANSFTNPYFGLLPWALATAACASCWRRDAWVRRLSLAALLAFVLAQRHWTPLHALLLRLPVLSSFGTWSRALFLVTFAVCALAAWGWDALADAATRARALQSAALFCAAALVAASLAWLFAGQGLNAALARMPWVQDHGAGLALLAADSARAALALACGLGLWIWAARRGVPLAWLLALAVCYHALDQGPLLRRFLVPQQPAQIAGRTEFLSAPPAPPGTEPWRVLDMDIRHPNNDILLGYENLYGAESVPLDSFAHIMDSMRSGGRSWLDWASLLNARYIFEHSKPEPWQDGDQLRVLANPSAFPRAWLAPETRWVPDAAAAWKALSDPAFKPRRTALLLGTNTEPDQPQALTLSADMGSVAWLSRTPQTCLLDVSAPAPAVLVLSNAWYPSWKALVDGSPAPLLKADGGLQALRLNAGRHQVAIRFDASLFNAGLAACLAGACLLLGLGLAGRRADPRGNSAPHG